MSEPAAAPASSVRSRRRIGARGRRLWLSGLALVLAGVVASCNRHAPPVRETLFVFGSETTLDLVDAQPEQRTKAMAAISEELMRMHRDWHPWEPGALTTLNEALARGEHAPLPESIRELIVRSRPIAMRSDGMFNPAVGKLVRLWGFHSSDYPVDVVAPSPEVLDDWRRRVPTLFDLIFDGDNVFTRNPSLQLDFSAIAEGFAAERIGLLLRAGGIGDALITLGGDVYAMGRPGERPWRVGIRDPFAAADTAFATVELHDGEALFTSGNYARFREAPAGQRWPHVVDPRSGLPARGVATVSVLHDDPLLADAAATALMVGGPARFSELLNRLDIRCALLLTEENELMVTAAMQQRLQLMRQPVPLGPPLGVAARCSERAPP